MTTIYVKHADLETGAANLKSHQKTFTEVLTQLESDLAPMIATWTGEAQQLYLQKKKLWDTAALDMTNILGHIAKITEDAHTDYAAVVAKLSELWD